MDGGKNGSGNGSIQGRLITEIRRRIIAGEIPPEVNISELALAEEFGVSRTPVRETFKQLQTEGLIEIRPRVGTFVTTPSRREIIELFEMKELLEGAAARLLAQRGRVPEIDQLEENLRQADQAVARDDRARYAELVQEFHDLLIVGADNHKLAAHYRMLMNQLAYSRLVTTSLQSARPATAVRPRAPPRARADRCQGRRQRRAGDARARPRQPAGTARRPPVHALTVYRMSYEEVRNWSMTSTVRRRHAGKR